MGYDNDSSFLVNFRENLTHRSTRCATGVSLPVNFQKSFEPILLVNVKGGGKDGE